MIGKTNIEVKPKKRVHYVDWIESTGTQYIDTEFKPNQNTKVIIDMMINSNGDYVFYGTRDDTNVNNYVFFEYPSSLYDGNFGIDYGATGGNPNRVELPKSTIPLNQRFVFMKDKRANYLDGVALQSNNTKTFSCNYNLILMARNSGGTVSTFASMKLYSFKIYDNGTLVRDFHPAMTEQGVFCLYEKVQGKYYYNQGTGFFLGPNPKQVEYIKGTGTQHINTGITPDGSTNVECKAQLVSTGSMRDSALLGVRNSSSATTTQYIVWYNNNTSEDTSDIGLAYASYVDTLYHGVGHSYHVVEVKNKSLYVDETQISTSTATLATVNYPLYLFAMNQGGSADSRKFNGKVFYCKIYSNGALIRNFIPVYIGTYCLYDLVENKYYFNEGTGNFSGGGFA